MTGERSCCYYNKFLWPDRYADCVPMDKALELLKSVKDREIAGDAKNCCIRHRCCIKTMIRLILKRLHETLSKYYSSVNFSILHLTVLKTCAITMPCSGERGMREP